MSNSKQLPTDYQQYIATSRYARWLDDKGRRETWEETVDRIIVFWNKQVDVMDISEEDKSFIRELLG